MLEDYIDSGLRKAIEELESKYPVSVDIRILNKKGFSGSELTVIVVGFLLSGITNGILSSIGKDIWKHIKSLCRHLRQREKSQVKYQISLKVQATIKGKDIFFICRLVPEDQIDKLDLFVINLSTKMQILESQIINYNDPNSNLSSLEFIKDGQWKETQSKEKN